MFQCSLYDKHGQLKFASLNDNSLLSAYHPENGWRVHIDDVDPNRTIANLTDVSQVCSLACRVVRVLRLYVVRTWLCDEAEREGEERRGEERRGEERRGERRGEERRGEERRGEERRGRGEERRGEERERRGRGEGEERERRGGEGEGEERREREERVGGCIAY